MNYTIVTWRWWSTESTVGLVVIDTGYGLKAYIGSPPSPFGGMNEDWDVRWIADHGTRMHETKAVEAIFPELEGKEWYEG